VKRGIILFFNLLPHLSFHIFLYCVHLGQKDIENMPDAFKKRGFSTSGIFQGFDFT